MNLIIHHYSATSPFTRITENQIPDVNIQFFSQFSALAASSIKKVQNHQKIKPLSTTSTTQSQPSMASSTQPAPNRHHSNLFHSATTALISLVSSPKASPLSTIPLCPPKICIPFQFADSSYPLIQSIRSPFDSNQPESVSPKSAAVKGLSSAESNSGFPSTVRIAGLKSNGKSGGPAFVGQVFSMCDLSGTGLMAVSTHFDIPFISKRYLLFQQNQYSIRVFKKEVFLFHGESDQLEIQAYT